jgi:L-fucose isomerase-like protein
MVLCAFRACRKLLRYICENGFEHHVAINLSTQADALEEAFTKYLGWDLLPR